MPRGKTKNKYLICNGVAVSHEWYHRQKLQRVKRALRMHKTIIALSTHAKLASKSLKEFGEAFKNSPTYKTHDDMVDAVYSAAWFLHQKQEGSLVCLDL